MKKTAPIVAIAGLLLVLFLHPAFAVLENTPENRCAVTAAFFDDFMKPLAQGCETKEDCMVVDKHCLPVFVAAKQALDEPNMKERFDKEHGNLLKACDFVIHSDKKCPRNINVRCDNHICGASDIVIDPSAFK